MLNYIYKLKKSKMKNVYSILVALAMFSIVACGPSADQVKEEATEDETQVDQTMNDIQQQQMDSTAAPEENAAAPEQE